MDFRRPILTGLIAVGLLAGCERPEQTEPVGTLEEQPAPTQPEQPAPMESEEGAPVEPAERTEAAPPAPGAMEEGPPGVQPSEMMPREDVEATAGIITVPAAGTFEEIKDRLDDAVEELEKFELSEVVEHHELAKKADIEVGKSVLFTVSSPELTATLIEQSPSIALDLPHRILVYEQAGRAQIAYYDPKVVASRHGIAKSDPKITRLHEVVSTVVDKAAKPTAVLGEEEMRETEDLEGAGESRY